MCFFSPPLLDFIGFYCLKSLTDTNEVKACSLGAPLTLHKVVCFSVCDHKSKAFFFCWFLRRPGCKPVFIAGLSPNVDFIRKQNVHVCGPGYTVTLMLRSHHP